jgi:hypothetical protein
MLRILQEGAFTGHLTKYKVVLCKVSAEGHDD